ncbi:uncharacterized protein PHALS_10071 [Plasmopara halstedii]|uniref:Uncharacterized protein n=1 Tax=Plasmopara halstedii TaxID=4781 RepID=A0A0P1AH72_PLAHL|nr:uncharacterized protein PHALS_10071 [Plasmopara halstedii]CEG39837.1 hypothetical protein PHALS_10071 [Plasmopara halstedii]|eukprot:XP_024576206.1 hypothetical protein PHALS_10071 [Plasmopara halstedii]
MLVNAFTSIFTPPLFDKVACLEININIKRDKRSANGGSALDTTSASITLTSYCEELTRRLRNENRVLYSMQHPHHPCKISVDMEDSGLSRICPGPLWK